jgi:hypothetical protein
MFKPKLAYRFRVVFDKFGTGTYDLTPHVTRIGRPGIAVFDIVGTDETSSPSIELTLCDDLLDRTRSEVIIQLAKQIEDNTKFALVIETQNEHDEVIEHWHLSGCRIVDCRFSELDMRSAEAPRIQLLISSQRIATRINGELLHLFR